ncbi:hypothetical protein [Collimonas silvisoli]|uniref:hypothetical protein n=1 Tax=Collimonas silvisoli TaxID=2825884 RepID=UPI001B8ACFBF|nr:hypothetical protein [Collimonas silvisoli]
MTLVKKVISICFIVLGMVSFAGNVALYFSSTLRLYIPGMDNANQFFGLLCALTSAIGGVQALRNRISAIPVLLASCLFYFLGAAYSALNQYGIQAFSMLMNAFYYSLGGRIIGAGIIATQLIRTRAAHYSEKPSHDRPYPNEKIALACLLLLIGLVEAIYTHLQLRGYPIPAWLQFGAAIVFLFLIFFWFHNDTKTHAYKRSTWLVGGILCMSVVTIPYYLVRSRGKGEKVMALIRLCGFFMLMLMSSLIGDSGARFLG